MNVSKNPSTSTKTDDGSASHCDETWLQSKSAGTSDFLWWGGTWLRWLFLFFFCFLGLVFSMITLSQEASRFFFQNLVRQYHFLIYTNGSSKNWNDASERCFCLPLTWRNKERKSPIQVRLTFLNFLFNFPTKSGETTKNKDFTRKVREKTWGLSNSQGSYTTSCFANFRLAFVFVHPTNFYQRYQTWRSLKTSHHSKSSFWASVGGDVVGAETQLWERSDWGRDWMLDFFETLNMGWLLAPFFWKPWRYSWL